MQNNKLFSKLIYRLSVLILIILKRKVKCLVVEDSLVLRRLFVIADHERNSKSSVKITQNDACTLQNQVRQQAQRIFFCMKFVFSHFQYLQVQIDSQGNLVKIVNLNKSITIPFTNQGLYWYEGMLITKIKFCSVFCSDLRSY